MRHQLLMVASLCIGLLLGGAIGSTAEPVRYFGESDEHPLNRLWNGVLTDFAPELLSESLTNIRALQHGEPHTELLGRLDAILSDPKLITDLRPLERLLLQQRLWRVFDLLASEIRSEWYTSHPTYEHEVRDVGRGSLEANRAVRARLASLIHLTVLTESEVDQLPSNYSAQSLNRPDEPISALHDLTLPPDLFDEDSEWMQVIYKSVRRIGLAHEGVRGQRSEALLFVRFPEGKEQGLKFIEQFNAHEHWQYMQTVPVKRRPKKPEFDYPTVPDGMQLILLSRLLAILPNGEVAPTSVIESIEFNVGERAFDRQSRFRQNAVMKHAAFKVSMEHLLSEEEQTLERIAPGEQFLGAQLTQVNGCIGCHQKTNDVLAFGTSAFSRFAPQPDDLSLRVVPNGTSPLTAVAKMNSFDFGLLRGFLDQQVETSEPAPEIQD
ncbi:MAG: hypothetical protein KDA86_16890 [Planctomycetaceae bacterium]|nr:hypothetical protein [Planctomycetaceae bacterium]